MKNNLYPLLIITALILSCNQTSKDKDNERSQIKTAGTVGAVSDKPVKNESDLQTKNEGNSIRPDDSTLILTHKSNDTIESEPLKNWDTLCNEYAGSEQKTFDLLIRFLYGGLEYINELGSEIGPVAEAAACACKTQRYKDSIQQYVASYDYRSACFGLRKRMDLLKRAKLVVEKNGELRKYLTKHSDIQHEGYWSCNPLSEFTKDLVFCHNRQNDGTKKNFETIVQETSRIAQQIRDASPPDTGKPPCSGSPVFFTPDGLYCDATVDNIFDKKMELFQAYIEDAFAIQYGLTGLAKRSHEGDTNRNVEIINYNDRAGGDGLTDIVVDASDNEKILYLQLPSGGFEKRTIKPYETHRSGGC